MKCYATIVEFKRYKRVTYYSIKQDDDDDSETDKFFNKLENIVEISEELDNIVHWIKSIGNMRGAQIKHFRPENLAVALPPPRNVKGTVANNIRLYCHWVNEGVVILFNGGVKTNIDPVLCKNVKPHFLNAQKHIKQLKEIGIDTTNRKITNIDELIIEF